MPEVAYTIHFGHMLDLYTVILEHLLPLLKIPWSPAQSLPKSLKSLSRYKNPFPELVEKTAIRTGENFRCRRFPLTCTPVSFTTGLLHAGLPFHRYSPVHRH